MVDVGGPHSLIPPNNNVPLKEESLPENATQSKVKVVKFAPTVQPTFSPDTEDEERLEDLVTSAQAQETAQLLPERPIVLYVSRDHTGPNARVVKVLPALAALKHNEKYSIIHGNSDALFTLNENNGIASLKFTRKVERRETHKLDILCEPVGRDPRIESYMQVKLEQLILHLEIHIL